jgi:hypothetical protein
LLSYLPLLFRYLALLLRPLRLNGNLPALFLLRCLPGSSFAGSLGLRKSIRTLLEVRL